MMSGILMLLSCAAAASGGDAAFVLSDDGNALSVFEQGAPVLVFRYRPAPAPEGAPDHLTRACYVHPLYGLDGDVITQDFPEDHLHHRGVFWAWPGSTIGDRSLDTWLLAEAHPVWERWIEQEAEADRAVVEAESVWVRNAEPDTPCVRERVRFVVHAKRQDARAIDITLRLHNPTDEVVTICGELPAGKGYGGLCIRPDARRGPLSFVSAQGTAEEDVLKLETPWAAVQLQPDAQGRKAAVAVFQHPGNPDYPHPGWIFRHYGFLGASWPHTQPATLEPDAHVELRYRLLILRDAEQEDLAARYAAYAAEATEAP